MAAVRSGSGFNTSSGFSRALDTGNFAGTAVENASAVISQAHDDADANGFPIGLASSVVTLGVGSGTLTVTLRHLPPENDTPVKTGTLADDVAAGGTESLPSETDASVDFALEVQ